MSLDPTTPNDDDWSSEDEFADYQPGAAVIAAVEDDIRGGVAAYGGGMLEDEARLLGPECHVTFVLPDGSTVDADFRMGHTLEVMKVWLEEHHGTPYEQTTLWLDDELLFDPLSISDTPLSSEEPNLVTVKVQSAEEST